MSLRAQALELRSAIGINEWFMCNVLMWICVPIPQSRALSTQLDQAWVYGVSVVLPSLAGDDPELLHLPIQCHLSGLPPLVVGCVHHVQDVPELKVEALAGQPRVLGFVIVKQRSATHTAPQWMSTRLAIQTPSVKTCPRHKSSMRSPKYSSQRASVGTQCRSLLKARAAYVVLAGAPCRHAFII